MLRTVVYLNGVSYLVNKGGVLPCESPFEMPSAVCLSCITCIDCIFSREKLDKL